MASLAIGGPIAYIEGDEQNKTDAIMRTAYERPWQLWKRDALGK